jgi:hypothetical protein
MKFINKRIINDFQTQSNLRLVPLTVRANITKCREQLKQLKTSNKNKKRDNDKTNDLKSCA